MLLVADHTLSSVQSLSHVWLFVTPWTAARQASLSITNSWSLLKPMSIESVMPSYHLILCCPLLLLPSIFPASGSFQMSQLSASGGQSIGVSASASVLPMNTQDWFSLGWTGWISSQAKGLSRVFSNTTVQKHIFNQFLCITLKHQSYPSPLRYWCFFQEIKQTSGKRSLLLQLQIAALASWEPRDNHSSNTGASPWTFSSSVMARVTDTPMASFLRSFWYHADKGAFVS